MGTRNETYSVDEANVTEHESTFKMTTVQLK